MRAARVKEQKWVVSCVSGNCCCAWAGTTRPRPRLRASTSKAPISTRSRRVGVIPAGTYTVRCKAFSATSTGNYQFNLGQTASKPYTGVEVEPNGTLATAQATVRIEDPLDNHDGRKGWLARLMERNPVDRAAPGGIHAVNAVAKERWKRVDYRPVPLRPFAPRLDPPVMPQDWTEAE